MQEDHELENKEISKRYKNLLQNSYQTFTKKDKQLIRKAFDFALKAHKTQRRRSGEPYIYHPIAVAKIVCVEIGMGSTSIASALLHDVVEDTDITLKDIQKNFGDKVARIIDGLTKISVIKDKNISAQAENFRKMILTLSDDIRVILIKLADRLHNMQTMEFMPRNKQVKIASETLFIYAPLAHRLGLYNIKTELEDLGLKYTETEEYQNILDKIEKSKEEQQRYIELFCDKVKVLLDKEGLEYELTGRPKSVYSIRKKMIKQDIPFEKVYDRFAIRIVFKSDIKHEKFNAWKIYSIITDVFTPNSTRLRDWITNPKSTGYEALHITVMGPEGKWVEIQIRSKKMNEIAERGYAAHYKYKNQDEDDNFDKWINKVKESLEDPETDAVEFVDNFKFNLLSEEIYVFTPAGELRTLPKNATALDFAYDIHTDIGAQCLSAKVDGKLVPLNYVLNSGDQIQIITSKNQKPKSSWLDFIVTSKAKSSIKSALNEQKKKIAKNGKEILMRKLRYLKIPLDDKTTTELIKFYDLQTSLDLFYKVGLGEIDNQSIKKFLEYKNNFFRRVFTNRRKTKGSKQKITTKNTHHKSNFDLLVFGKDEQKLDYTLAPCCNPIVGDHVFGFISINEGIKVHRKNCSNAISLQSNYSYRILPAKWINAQEENFNTILKLNGIDKLGILSSIINEIYKIEHIELIGVNVSENAGTFEGSITLKVNNQEQLSKTIQNLQTIKGMNSVKRIS